jgi:hypothetical protein
MASAFDDIVVCLPTVRLRAAVLAETLAQWARHGVTPLVEIQPDDWPVGGASQRRTAEVALRRALDTRPDATHVLYTEDDIDLASDIAGWLPALRALDAAATLYVTGDIHYPLAIRQQLFGGQPLDTGIYALERLERWYGTLAVLLPRDLAEAVLCWESGVHGWDLQLQHFLAAHALPLYVTVPNLVQHRGVPTVASPAGGHERSATFGVAVKGQRLTVG